jgi:hypothetical protein
MGNFSEREPTTLTATLEKLSCISIIGNAVIDYGEQANGRSSENSRPRYIFPVLGILSPPTRTVRTCDMHCFPQGSVLRCQVSTGTL